LAKPLDSRKGAGATSQRP